MFVVVLLHVVVLVYVVSLFKHIFHVRTRLHVAARKARHRVPWASSRGSRDVPDPKLWRTVYIKLCVYIYIYIYMCVCVYIYIYIYTHI